MKAFAFPAPSARSGSEMIAPSGKFWMAMPRAKAIAPASVMFDAPLIQPAKTTPTAMPSGKLCSVTASTISVVRASWVEGPSGASSPRCRCGIAWSSAKRKSMPNQKPIAAGINASLPHASLASIAGTSRLHTLAATITPAAKPASARSTSVDSWSRMKKTSAEPRVVPAKGISRPASTS